MDVNSRISGVCSYNTIIKLQDSATNTFLNAHVGTVVGNNLMYNNVFGIGVTTSGNYVAMRTNKYLWEFTQMLEFCGKIGLVYTVKGLISERLHFVKRISTTEQDPSDLMHSFINIITTTNSPSSQFLASYLLAMLMLGGVPQDGVVYVPLYENPTSCIVYRIKDVNLMSLFLSKCMVSGVVDDVARLDFYKAAKFINHENMWKYFKMV